MLFIIDNEQGYDAHKLYFVETNISPPRVKELLTMLGPAHDYPADPDPAPNIILITDVAEWVRLEHRRAFFDCEVWRLLYAHFDERFADEMETKQHKLMNTALREEHAEVLREFTRPGYGARRADGLCLLDETVPRRAAEELHRRGVIP